jgi:hypothetical protein
MNIPKRKSLWFLLYLSVGELKSAGIGEPILLHEDNLFQEL